MKNSNSINNSVDFVEIDINTGNDSDILTNIENKQNNLNEPYVNARRTIDSAINYIKKEYGKIDILVNNAGYAAKCRKSNTAVDVESKLIICKMYRM